jgi:hypothetical protein
MNAEPLMTAFYEPTAFRVRDAIAEGYEVHKAADDLSRYATEAQGFGLARLKTEGMADEEWIDAWDRSDHFYWPNPMDAAEEKAATLYGDPTPEEYGAIETLAIMTIRSRGEGARWLFWRVEPYWEHERRFGDVIPQNTHRLMMRGSFVWENKHG